jgi:FtsZ-binding cell division protein ZapB
MNILPQNPTPDNGQTPAQYSKNDNRIVNRLFWAVSVAVALIALGSFTLSFTALLALATGNGIPAGLGWIWPLIVDLSMVIYTAAILVAQLQHRNAKLPIALTIFYALVTITGNVLHAPSTPLGWFVASLPPLSLILGSEMLRVMSHHIITRKGTLDTLAALSNEVDALTVQRDTLTSQCVKLQVQMETLKSETQALKIGQNSPKIDTLNIARETQRQARLDTLLAFLSNNPHASLTQAAAGIGASRQTVSNYVSELNEAGKLSKNGHGWEVSP